MNAIDMLGKRCHGWTVEARATTPPHSSDAWWLVRCDCGRSKIEIGKTLRSGVARACHNAGDLELVRTAVCPEWLWDEYPCLASRVGHVTHFYDIRTKATP